MPIDLVIPTVHGIVNAPAHLAPIEARRALNSMRGRKVLVVGDVMLDEWIWGTVSRISPEAPVPVVAVTSHSFTLGGAGNVANNLRAIGAEVAFASVVGDDREADRILELLDEIHVDRSAVLRLNDRPTTRKTRVVAHNQQVVRADWESSAALLEPDTQRFADVLRRRAPDFDAVILSDYAKGLFSRAIVDAALQSPVIVADPKPKNLSYFSGVTLVAPNVHEAALASGIEIVDDASLQAAGKTLLRQLDCRYVVITRGDRGMVLFGRDGERHSIPAVARTVFDVSGAGDTVVAMLTLALAADVPVERALELANFSAGAVVEKLGTAVATPDEIVALLEDAAFRASAEHA